MRAQLPLVRVSAALTLAMGLALCLVASAHTQPRYIDGVFVNTPSGPVELIAYAEPNATGRLQLSGAMDDVPTLAAGCRVLVSIPGWKTVGAIIASEAIFDDPRAERRDLRWAVRSINIYAVDITFRELDNPAFVTRMLNQVKASEERAGLVFVAIANGGIRGLSGTMVRYYPMRLEPPSSSERTCKS